MVMDEKTNQASNLKIESTDIKDETNQKKENKINRTTMFIITIFTYSKIGKLGNKEFNILQFVSITTNSIIIVTMPEEYGFPK